MQFVGKKVGRVIPGRAKREPGIHNPVPAISALSFDTRSRISARSLCSRPGMTTPIAAGPTPSSALDRLALARRSFVVVLCLAAARRFGVAAAFLAGKTRFSLPPAGARRLRPPRGLPPMRLPFLGSNAWCPSRRGGRSRSRSAAGFSLFTVAQARRSASASVNATALVAFLDRRRPCASACRCRRICHHGGMAQLSCFVARSLLNVGASVKG